MIRLDERLIPTRTPLTPARLRALAHALRAGSPALRALSLEQRVVAVDRVATSWLADGSVWRRRALAELPMSTGYPPAAVAVALDHLWNALRAAQLTDALRAEAREDATHPLPGLALHVLAGNVPGVGIFGIVAALLAGIASLVKPAAREPFLPDLFVESIAAVAPELQCGLALAPWRGGTEELDATALHEADVVLAYGRDDTLDRLAARAPHRLLRHGSRLSAALIEHSALTRTTARLLAQQIALYDQQGCLSPQIACVEDTGRRETDAFAALVADALGALEHELPRVAPTLAESAAVWRFLETQRWRAQEGAEVAVHGGREGFASVVCDRSGEWSMSPTFRHLVMVPVPTLGASRTVLGRITGVIEAIGYAGPMHRLAEASAIAADLGASRLCPLERLQAPPFAWRQSGHARLGCFAGLGTSAGPPPAFA
jgi:acyl-CoA reductase-like NAD-dependent aldehyde dehydrogenase